MKKIFVLLVVIAVIIGGLLVWDQVRAKPPVYKSVLGSLALPHCPSCEQKLVPYADCSACGRKIVWESAEKTKAALEKAGESIDQTVQDLKK